VVDVEDQGKVERVGAGGQGFGQDAVAPDVLEGDAALVPAEVVGEVAGGDRSGAQGAFAREQDVPVGGVRPGGAPVVKPGQQGVALPADPLPESHTGSQHPHIHLAPSNPVHTQPSGRLIGGGKPGHVHDHVPGCRDRPFHLGHIRPSCRKVPQLGGMRDEHPPPGGFTRISWTGQAPHASVTTHQNQPAGTTKSDSHSISHSPAGPLPYECSK
jgi:hypothetical protein